MYFASFFMPYASEKQRAWMHINKPKIAKKWDKKYGGKVKKKKKAPWFWQGKKK